MKYIVTESDEGLREIFVFPRGVNHDTMAEAIGHIKNQSHGEWRRVTRKPVSAGFVEGGRCCGRSESLKLEPAEGDTELLNSYSGATVVMN